MTEDRFTPALVSPRFYFHLKLREEWGLCLFVSELGDKRELLDENLTLRTVGSAGWAHLEEEFLDPEDTNERAQRLVASFRERARKAAKKASPAARQATPLPSFARQLEAFEKKFPRGFEDPLYVETERGAPGRYKTRALERARAELSPEALAKHTPADTVKLVKSLLSTTNIVHPQEGSIRFSTLPESHHRRLHDSLLALLHGEGHYEPRFDAYVDAFLLYDKSGRECAPGWPLCSLLPALYAPEVHTAVKLSFFAQQAEILAVHVDYSSKPRGQTYTQLQSVAREALRRLRDAGHQPCDMLDAYTFIWATLSRNSTAYAGL